MPQSASDILRAALKQGNPNLSEKELNTTLGSMTPTPVKVETPTAQPKPSEPKPLSYYTPSQPFAKVSVRPAEPSSPAILKPVVSNSYGTVGEKNDKVVEFRKLQAEATKQRDDLNKYKPAVEGYLKTKKVDGKAITEDQTKKFNEYLANIDKFNKAYELDFGAINIKGIGLDRAKQFRQPSLEDLKTIKTIDLSEENLKKIRPDSEEYKYGELLKLKLLDREEYARAFFGDSYANYQKKINQEIQKQNKYSVYNYNNPLVNPISRSVQNVGSLFAEGLDRVSGDYAYTYYDAIKNTEKKIKDAQQQYDKYRKVFTSPDPSNKDVEFGVDYNKELDKLERQLYGTGKEGGTLYKKLNALKKEGSLSYESRAWLGAFSNITKLTEQLDSKIVKKKAEEIVKSKQVIDSTASSLQSLNVPNKFYYVDPSGKEHFIDQSDKDKLSQQIFDKAFNAINSKTDPSKFTLSSELRAYAAKFPNSPYVKNIERLGKERGPIQEGLSDIFKYIWNAVTWTPEVSTTGLTDNPFDFYMKSKNMKDITNPLLRDININDWMKDFLYTSGFEGDIRTINAQAEDRDEKIDLLVGGTIPRLRKQIELTIDPTLKKKYQDQLTAKVAELKRLEQDNIKEKERDAVLLKSLENSLSTQGKLSEEFIAKKESQDPDSFESVFAGSAQTTRDLLQFMAIGAAATAVGRITGGAVSAIAPSLATSMTAASEAFVVLANRHLESKMEVNDAVSSNYDRYLNQMLAENGVSQKDIELMTKAEKELALPQEVLIELRNRARLGKEELYWKNMALAIPDLLQLRMLKSAFLKPAGVVGQEASNQITSDIIRTFGGVTVNLSSAGKSILQAYGTGYLGEKGEEGFQNLGQRTQQQRSEKYDAPSFLSSFRTLVTDAYNTATSIRALPSISMTTLGGLYSDDKEFQYAAELGGFSGGVMGGMSAVSNISRDVYGFTFANKALKELGIFDTGFVSDIIAGEALRRSFEKGNSEYILKLLQNKKKILLANDADGKKFSPNNSKENLQNIDDPLLQELRTIAADRAARGDSSLLEHIEFLEKEAKERKLYSARTAEEAYDAFVNRYLLARELYNSGKKNISKYRGNILSFVGDEESRKDLSAEQRANMERDSKGLLGAYNRFNSVLAENAFAYARGKEDLAYFKSLREKLVDSELEQLSSVHPNLNKNTLSLLYQLNAIPEMDLEDPRLQMIIAQDPSYKERFEKAKTYYDKLRTDLTKQLEDEINNNEKSKEFLKDLIDYNHKNEFSINLSKLKELKGVDPTKSFLNEVVGQAFVLSNLNNTSFEFAGNQIKKLGKIKNRRQLVNWYNDHLSEAEKRLMKIRNQQLRDLINKEQNGEELTEEEEDLKNKLTQSAGLPDTATNEEIVSELEDQPTEEGELEEEGKPVVVTLTNNHLFNTFPENPINIKVKLEKYKLAKNIKGLRKLIDNGIEFDLVEVNNKDGYFIVSYGNQLYTLPITGGPLDATNNFTPNLNNEEDPGTQLELDIFEYTTPQEPVVELVDINEAEADRYGDLTEEELQQELENIETALFQIANQLEVIDEVVDMDEETNPYRIVADNMEKMNTKSVKKSVGLKSLGKEGLLAYVSNNVKLTLDGLASKIWSEYFRDTNLTDMDIRDMIIELLRNGKKKFLEDNTAFSDKKLLEIRINDLERERNVILNYLNKVRQEPAKNTVTDIERRRIETEAKIKRKDLFIGVGEFSTELGGSDKAAVPVLHTEINGIEFVQYAHPETGSIDVIVTGISDNDFVGFYRLYENGKPTNKWSSKFENQSRNKEAFKTMISGVQEMLPQGHEYTEKTSISTDGLRIWEQQLRRGYELQYDENGELITNLVAINGDAIVNELGIPVEKGQFTNIRVKSEEEFEIVKKALLPYLKKLGLTEKDIKFLSGTVKINLPILKKSETTTKEKKNLKPGAKGKLIWVSPGFGKTTAALLLNDLIDADTLMEEALLEVVPDGSATRQSLLKNGKHYSKQAEVQALFISKIEQALAEGKTVVTANWMVAAASKKGRLKIDVVVQATDPQDIVNRTKDRADSALDMDASQKQIQRANELPVSRRFTLMPGQTLYDVLVEGSEQTVSEILPQPLVTIIEVVAEAPVVEEPIGKEVNDPRMQVRVYEFTSMTVDQNAGDAQQRVRNKRAFVNNPQRNQTHNLTITVPNQATIEELRKLGMIPGMPVIPYTFLQNGLINPSKLNKQQLQALREGKPFLVKINPNITTRISITNRSRNEIMNLQSPDTYYIVIPNKDFKPEVAIVDGKETITNLNLLSVKLFDPNEYSEPQLAKILKFNNNNTQATSGEIRQFVESYNINKIIFNNLSGIIKPGSPINISLEELAKYGISVDITSGMIKFTPQLFDISSFTENETLTSVFEGVGPIVVRMTSNGVIEFLNPNLTREQQNQIRSTNLGNDGGYKLIIKHPVTNKLMFIDIKIDDVALDRSTQGTLIKQAILKLTNAVSTAFDENITDIKFYNDQMKLFGLKDAELSIINRNPNASGLFFNLKLMVSNGEVVLNQEGKPTFILEIKKNNKIVAKVPIDEILAQDSVDDIMKVIADKIVGTSTESEAAKKALSDTTGISISAKNKDINAILNTGKTNVSPTDPFTESQVALNLAENIISELSPEEIEEIIVSELEGTPELPDSNNTNGSVALKLFDTFYENNIIDVDTILDENEVSLEKIRELIQSQEKVFRTILEFEAFVKENAC